jgi:serine/threonine protein kinase
MNTYVTCSCGLQWDQASSNTVVCPSCGAFAPHLGTKVLGATAVESIGTTDANTVVKPAQTGTPIQPTPEGYEVLGVLGRGGMGVVYKARDVRLGRVVAIKTILAGSQAPPELLDRFVTEATAVAKLKHPNIVQLHTVTEADGHPCLVMEFVPGGSLSQRLNGEPQSPATSADIVRKLARAVHTAHQAGVVHRDLKPANVLLAFSRETPASADCTLARVSRLNECEPKVADFGLAKQLDSGAGPTRSGEVLGTPSYMAPEQAGGMTRQVTPLVDVYALGAILYEMLTGRPPFRADEAFRTVMQVISDDPIAPRRLQPGVPLDLETICLKCLEKKPAKRYASAAALADDLQRFLDGKSVEARPAGSVERLAKWARRRPTVAALIGVSAAALLAVLAIGIAYNVRMAKKNQELTESKRELTTANGKLEVAVAAEIRERSKAEDLNTQLTTSNSNLTTTNEKLKTAITAEAKQRTRAEGTLLLAAQSLDQFTDTAVSELRELPRSARVQKEVQEATLPMLDAMAQQDQASPAMQLLRGRAARRLGRSEVELDRKEQGRQHLQQAIETFERLRKDHPDNRDYRAELADAVRYLADDLDADDPKAAERSYRRARVLLESPDDGDPWGQADRAAVCNNLARLLVRGKRFDEARTLYREALDLRKKLLPKDEDGRQRLALAQTLNNLGALERKADRLDDAVTAYQKALDEIALLPADLRGRLSSRVNRAMFGANLGEVLEQQKRFDRAAQAYTGVAEQWESLALDFPFEPTFRENAAYVQRRLAIALLRQDKTGPAEQALRRACRHGERLALDYPEQQGHAQEWVKDLAYLDDVLNGTGQKAAADALWKRAEEEVRAAKEDRTGTSGPATDALAKLLAAIEKAHSR